MVVTQFSRQPDNCVTTCAQALAFLRRKPGSSPRSFRACASALLAMLRLRAVKLASYLRSSLAVSPVLDSPSIARCAPSSATTWFGVALAFGRPSKDGCAATSISCGPTPGLEE
jgi:hypothetical protein